LKSSIIFAENPAMLIEIVSIFEKCKPLLLYKLLNEKNNNKR
jgi:hypothetical protein